MAKSNGKSDADATPAEKPRRSGKGSAGRGASATGFRGYLERTKFPIYSILFVVPLAFFYEVAVVYVNRPLLMTEGVTRRVTADKLIRDGLGQLLDALGVHGAARDPNYFGVASVIVLILVMLGWQIAARKGWEIRPMTLLGVLGESVLFGFVWLLLARLVVEPVVRMTIENSAVPWLYSRAFGQVVFAVGAGVYEEFVFRMLLVWVIGLVVVGITSLEWNPSRFIGVVIAAVIFSAHHHTGLGGADPFTWPLFTFRLVSGLFFGILYYMRGFGVAVGCHAVYNISYYFLIEQYHLLGSVG